MLTAWRIGDAAGSYPVFDATGSTLYPGRWNTEAAPILYASEHYSTAMLEKLVRSRGLMPPNQHFVEVTIPNGVSYEVVTAAHLPGWDDPKAVQSKAFGTAWQHARRSLLLLVPSVVARMERNILINPEHPEFGRLQPGLHQPVWWDGRLFGD